MYMGGAKYLTIMVTQALKEGVASGVSLRPLRQRERELEVDSHAHPLTMTDETSVSRFFKSGDNTSSADVDGDIIHVGICKSDFTGKIQLLRPGVDPWPSPNKKRVRVTAGLRVCPNTGFPHDLSWFLTEYGEDEGRRLWGEASEESFDEEGSPAKTASPCAAVQTPSPAAATAATPDSQQKEIDSDGFVPQPAIPEFEEFRINKLMKDLNAALRAVPNDPTQQQVIEQYRILLRQDGWKTRTTFSPTTLCAPSSYCVSRDQQHEVYQGSSRLVLHSVSCDRTRHN